MAYGLPAGSGRQTNERTGVNRYRPEGLAAYNKKDVDSEFDLAPPPYSPKTRIRKLSRGYIKSDEQPRRPAQPGKHPNT